MKQADITFARRFDGVSGSAIREVFKLLGVPGMISFAGGNPAESALQEDVVAQLAAEALSQHGKKILQYGATEGWQPYRVQTAEFLRQWIGIDVDPGEILPTTGSTQGVDLLLKALINEGDVVLVEGPSFLGSLQAMRLYGAKLVPVAMDADGIRLDALEEAVRAHRPKLLYTVPNFQNPTGVTLSVERRKAIAEMAEQYDFLIAEDDPYRGLRYRGEGLPTIFSFDEAGRVIYLTSYSKLIAPGLRTGAVATRNQALLRRLTVGKQSTDVHTPTLVQAIVAQYLEKGLMPAHLERICTQYAAQLGRMAQGIPALGEGTRASLPDGGLFLWVELPQGHDAAAMLDKAVKKGVAYVPGTHFYADGGHANTMRLNFSNSSPDQIDRGMALLAETIHEEA